MRHQTATLLLCFCCMLSDLVGSEAQISRAKRDENEAHYKTIETNLDKLKNTITTALKDNDESKEKAQGILFSISDLRKNVRTRIKTGDIGTLGKATTSVVGAIDKILKADKPYEVPQAITESLATVTAMLPPPVGPAVSTVLSIVTAFLSLGIPSTPRVQDVVQEIVQKAMDAEHLRNLNEEVNGAKYLLSQAVDVLAVYEGNDWGKSQAVQKQNDMMFLGQQVRITEGLPLLGKMEYYINDEMQKMLNKLQPGKEITSGNAVAKESVEKLLKSVEGYVQLFALRQTILHSMRSVYNSAEGTAVADKAIRKLYDSGRSHAANFLKFLHFPNEKTVFFMTSAAMANGTGLYQGLKGLGIDVLRNEIVGDNSKPVCGYIETVLKDKGLIDDKKRELKFWSFLPNVRERETERKPENSGVVKLVTESERQKFQFVTMKDGGIAIRVRGSREPKCPANPRDAINNPGSFSNGNQCSVISMNIIKIHGGRRAGLYFIGTMDGMARLKTFVGEKKVANEHDWVNPGDDTFFKITKTAC